MRWAIVKVETTLHLIPERTFSIVAHVNADKTKSYLITAPPFMNVLTELKEMPVVYESYEEAVKVLQS